MAKTGTDIIKAQQILSSGELVAIPTETVYGLAANALDIDAITKIFTTKERPSFDPLIVHTDSLDKVKDYVQDIPEEALKLAKAFWPGPMTLLLKKKDVIPDLVTSGLDTVAIRVPRHPLTKLLLETLDFPLAAPSANPFGYISPTTAQHVEDQLGDKIQYILDGGACTVGVESTIIGFEGEQPTVYRLGGKSVEDIEEVVGEVHLTAHSSSNPQAPGMLKSHYAPKIPLELGNIEKLIGSYPNERLAVLAFNRSYDHVAYSDRLTSTDDMHEAAQNLFGKLRELDNLSVDRIITEPVPDEGLGKAINDRLKRAAAK